MRKLILAAAALASLAPVAASAQPHGGGYGGGYGNGYGGGYGYNQGYRGNAASECFRSLRFVRNRWEAERRREECQRIASRGYRGDRGNGHYEGRGRGW